VYQNIILGGVYFLINKIFRWILSVVGLVIGFTVTQSLVNMDGIKNLLAVNPGPISMIIETALGTLLFGLIFYLFSPILINLVWKLTELIEGGLQKIPTNDIIIGVTGLIIGLIISNLIISSSIKFFANGIDSLTIIIGWVIALVVNIIIGTLSINLAIKRKEDIYNVFTFMRKFGKDKKNKADNKNGISQPKILDTSVIIDGRIFDIFKTGFIEGPIIIPSFVLEELRHIADSSDNLKRARGRRGLDILNQIQKELQITVEISEKDFPNIAEVDSKLLKLAQVLNGKVITNDFNLNKVAEFQGVAVLNINELANGVKPVVIPGEEMHLQIIKDGKESGQGIAYLDDGTMIVIEGGRKHVGEHVEVIVTSVLQTAAGRMIFARIKTLQDKAVV
jgi:uncharacterized protein YacL